MRVRTRRRRFPAVAAAALCIGGLASCSRESGAPAPPAEDARGARPLATDGATSKQDLDQKLDAYLGEEKQVYGDESRDYLHARREDLAIPVPPVEPMERKAPMLALPEASEPDPAP